VIDFPPSRLPQSDANPSAQDHFYTTENHAFYASKQYYPLDYTKREIRLVEFISFREGRPLKLKLISRVAVSDETAKPKYYALSYHAGSYKDTTTLKVNVLTFTPLQISNVV
jgi:hypothetical protein